MEFVTVGSRDDPALLLIHPSKCDGHCFEVLYPYLRGYRLICPTLGGHNLDDDSVYEGGEAEAGMIERYLRSEGVAKLHAVLGVSIGAVVAYWLNRRGKVAIGRLVFDGAPFRRMSDRTKRLIIKRQIEISDKCRENPQGKFRADTMYPQLAPMMKKVSAHYSEATIRNIINDVGLELDGSIDSERVTFLYGEKDFYRRAIGDVKKAGYKCRREIRKGCGHIQWMLKEPEQYAKALVGDRV
ncbi:MAG: alpha/beta hydrolase [Clostridiales Family XIII bacterium]|jgi:pimeloyl-ACP methyl ester carboxylesterase|nr:alpha/beta hydrolase [Clostridiales Family XIII bacterium]